MGGGTANAGILEAVETNQETINEKKNQENGNKRKKVRRGGKKIKNKLKNFKILYVNLRGFKSKKKSIENILEEEKPTMIALTETLIEDKENVEIKGFEIYKPAEKGSRGILIAVSKELKNITSIVMENNSVGEQMWIKMSPWFPLPPF